MSSSPLSSLPEQSAELLATIAAFATLDELREAEPAITGKRSIFAVLQKSLGALEPDERKSAGAQLQEARRVVVEAFDARRQEFELEARRSVLEADRLDLGDVVESDVPWTLSSGHPGLVAITQQELEDVFVAMGFNVCLTHSGNCGILWRLLNGFWVADGCRAEFRRGDIFPLLGEVDWLPRRCEGEGWRAMLGGI